MGRLKLKRILILKTLIQHLRILLDAAIGIRNIQKGRALQADIHEGRLHARKNLHRSAPINVPHNAPIFVSLDMDFHNRAPLNEGYPGFLQRGIHNKLSDHERSPHRV